MLLDYFSKDSTILNRKILNTPEGGYLTTWEDGAAFTSYTYADTSTEAQIAEKQGLTTFYNVLVKQDVPLEYGTYYREDKSGRTFRVTSEPSESYTPSSSGLNLKQFSAEKVVLS